MQTTRTGTDIQDEPESTIGRKPSELQNAEAAQPAAAPAGAGQPLARERIRQEEGEESELGPEIRARDEELARADADRDSVPIPLDEREP